MKRTTHNGVNLGIWLSRLRQDMDLLSAEKINALNAIGMTWVLRPERLIGGLSINQLRRKFSNQTDDQWLEYWLRFKENVPSRFNALDHQERRDSERHVSEKELLIWIDVQRILYQKGQLSQDRQRRIDYLTNYILASRT